jgi:hypothetical protein
VIEIRPPDELPEARGSGELVVFIAGSIEMGKAVPWQAALVQALSDVPNVILLNPRRSDWDPSWVQSRRNPQFREQVEWELSGQDLADVIAFYFAPGTLSPVSLLELGLAISDPDTELVVCCPEGYFRKGNVDITCERYDVNQVDDLDALTKWVRRRASAQARLGHLQVRPT